MDNRPRYNSVGLFLVSAIILVAFSFVFFADSPEQGRAATTQTVSSTVLLSNAPPLISGFAVNNGTNVTLIPNGTTTVTVNYTVTDDNGCGSVFYTGNVTSTFYRSGVSSTCATANPTQSLLNCYVVATTTHNCPGANSTTTSANVTTTFQVWYFADSTSDTSTASSTYPSQNWLAYASARDASSTTGASSSATGVEMNTLLAIQNATSGVNYGTVNPNTNTGATNQTINFKNAGNATSGIQTYGTAMCNGGTCIATSSQHYATSTFTYGGGEQQLQSVAMAVGGWLANAAPLGSPWTNTSPLKSDVQFHGSVISNGYIYALGGAINNAASETSTVQFALVNATGSLGAWATTTPLLSKTQEMGAATLNGYIYVTGGWYVGGDPTSTVQFALVNATGSLGAWATTTPLPRTRSTHITFINNNYIYAIGGWSIGETFPTTTVVYAPINATGSLGSWSSTTPLLSGLGYHAGTVWNNYIYVLGGQLRVGPVVNTSTVIYAPINATGSLGAWTSTTRLPHFASGTNQLSAFADNGFLYAIGGWDESRVEATATVMFAPINANGSLGAWSRTYPLPDGLDAQATVAANGFLYNVGGWVEGPDTETTDVSYAPLPSRNTYWGLANPGGTPQGVYSGVNTFVAVYSP